MALLRKTTYKDKVSYASLPHSAIAIPDVMWTYCRFLWYISGDWTREYITRIIYTCIYVLAITPYGYGTHEYITCIIHP